MKVLRGEGFAPRFMQRLIAVKCNPFHIIDIITQNLLSFLTAGLHALNRTILKMRRRSLTLGL